MNLNRVRLDFESASNPRIRLLPGSDFLNTTVKVNFYYIATWIRFYTRQHSMACKEVSDS